MSLRRACEVFFLFAAVCAAVVYSGFVLAFPIGGCPKVNPLLDLINYVGEDRREYLDDPDSKLEITPEERDRIRKVTGEIKCKAPNGGYYQASGSLAGKGDEIITTAHTFKDEKTGVFAEPLSECTFTNYDTPPATSKLAISKSHEGLLIGYNFPKNLDNDYAFAKLVNPISSAKPFPVDLSDTAIHNFKQTFIVSAMQEKMPKHSTRQPIIVPCEVEDQFFFGASTSYYNDCTTFNGSSGGAQLSRNSAGVLVLKGFDVRGGRALKGDYDHKAGAYDQSVAIGGRILTDLKKFDPSISIGNGGIDDSKY